MLSFKMYYMYVVTMATVVLFWIVVIQNITFRYYKL
jgi:hypothetical protein